MIYHDWMETEADSLEPINKTRDLNLALCLSSYKRIEDLQRQLYALLGQTYRQFHIFAAVKGIPDNVVAACLTPLFSEEIAAGRLTLRLFPNKNQLSNLLDTVRGLPVDDYDLFLKIDDDDIYGRAYLQHIRDFHRMLPVGWNSSYGGICSTLERSHGFPLMGSGCYSVFGSSFAWTRTVLDRLWECERNPSGMIPGILKRTPGGFDAEHIGFAEDNLIYRIMQEQGCANRAPYLKSQCPKELHLIVQKSNPSVTRGGLLDDRFLQDNSAISDAPATWEHCIAVRGKREDALVIVGNAGYLLRAGEQMEILSFDGQNLAARTQNGEEKLWSRREGGIFEGCV